MSEPLSSFAELVLHARRDRDYRLKLLDLRAGATVIAIHGGGIEPLTSELAAAIAGSEYNLYDLQGIRPVGNDELRIPIARFDEMRLGAMVKRGETALSIDGVPGDEPLVHMGGGNHRLKHLLADRFSEAGWIVAGPATPGAAHDPTRFYNRCTLGGVHVELSEGLRCSMISCPLECFAWQDATCWKDAFYRFVDTVRSGLGAFHAQVHSDLDITMQRFDAATAMFPPSLRRPPHYHNDDNGTGR